MRTHHWGLVLLAILSTSCLTAPHSTNPTEPSMTNDRLDALIRQLDPQARRSAATWSFTIDDRQLLLITDERADRMRVMAPVSDTDTVTSDISLRMLQANFDTALDARYAIAHEKVWSVFVHPLGALTETEFLLGVSQVATLAGTFGTSYSSGTLMFQGGDTAGKEERHGTSVEGKRKTGQDL